MGLSLQQHNFVEATGIEYSAPGDYWLVHLFVQLFCILLFWTFCTYSLSLLKIFTLQALAKLLLKLLLLLLCLMNICLIPLQLLYPQHAIVIFIERQIEQIESHIHVPSLVRWYYYTIYWGTGRILGLFYMLTSLSEVYMFGICAFHPSNHMEFCFLLIPCFISWITRTWFSWR